MFLKSLRLCVYAFPPPGGGAARFPSLETVKTVTSKHCRDSVNTAQEAASLLPSFF